MKSFKILVILCGILLSAGTRAQTFTNYTTADGLPSNVVNGVAIDAGQNIWLATDEGVAKFDGTAWTVYTMADGLIDNYVLCVAVDADNHIWVGTDVGVSTYSNGTWTNYTSADGLVYDMVSYICSDNSGGVWIGTGEGLSHFTGSTFVNYTTANGLSGNMISYLFDDPQGDLWIGTWLTGLMKFDGTTFVNYTTTNNLADNNILCVKVDDFGKKWIGTYKGITVFDASNNYLESYNADAGLYQNYVQDICFDPAGLMFVGIYVDYLMDGAVSLFFNDEWVSFTMASGLVSEQVKRMAVDQSGNIWIATGNGLSKLKVNNIGYEELDPSAYSRYPNPATGELYIHTSLNSAVARLMDVSGRVVLEQVLEPATNRLPVSGLQAGTYILEVREGNAASHSRVVVY